MRPGSVLDVATMDVEPGSRIELREVLLVADGGSVTVGDPLVSDAVVVLEVMEHGKGRKVVNFKYKAKVRYRRKRGHRQGFTKLTVREISFGGNTALDPRISQSTAEAAEPAQPRSFAGRAAETSSTEEAPGAEEAPAPRARASRRRTVEEQTPEEEELQA